MCTADHPWNLGSALRALRPVATSLLDITNAYAWTAVSPALLELLRLKVAALIGNKAGLARRSAAAREQGLTEAKIAQLDDYYKLSDFSDAEKQSLAFAEMFVVDVSSLTASDAEALGRYFSTEQRQDLVVALYVIECTQRIEMAGRALLGGSADEPWAYNVAAGDLLAASRSKYTHGQLEAALARYQEIVVQGSDLDTVVSETVRLRCARAHNCRFCRTLRLVEAIEAGVDDEMTAKIDFYENSDLDERIKIALRITDAFITRPDSLTAATISQARSTFTSEALAELCLDITKWSTQKIYVSLGTDGAERLPKDAHGVSFFDFDEQGRVGGFSASPSLQDKTDFQSL